MQPKIIKPCKPPHMHHASICHTTAITKPQHSEREKTCQVRQTNISHVSPLEIEACLMPSALKPELEAKLMLFKCLMVDTWARMASETLLRPFKPSFLRTHLSCSLLIAYTLPNSQVNIHLHESIPLLSQLPLHCSQLSLPLLHLPSQLRQISCSSPLLHLPPSLLPLPCQLPLHCCQLCCQLPLPLLHLPSQLCQISCSSPLLHLPPSLLPLPCQLSLHCCQFCCQLPLPLLHLPFHLPYFHHSSPLSLLQFAPGCCQLPTCLLSVHSHLPHLHHSSPLSLLQLPPCLFQLHAKRPHSHLHCLTQL
ncbi:unnamed protein product, partial [Closterium sp. NIES-54]